MLGLKYLKKFQKIKDVADIICQIEKLDCLGYQNDWYAVNRHLQDVSQKHMIEKVLYNSVNQTMPQSIQQSAANCRQFLLALGAEKITNTKELSKHPGGN